MNNVNLVDNEARLVLAGLLTDLLRGEISTHEYEDRLDHFLRRRLSPERIDQERSITVATSDHIIWDVRYWTYLAWCIDMGSNFLGSNLEVTSEEKDMARRCIAFLKTDLPYTFSRQWWLEERFRTWQWQVWNILKGGTPRRKKGREYSERFYQSYWPFSSQEEMNEVVRRQND